MIIWVVDWLDWFYRCMIGGWLFGILGGWLDGGWLVCRIVG